MPVIIVNCICLHLNSAHWTSHKLYYTNRVCCLGPNMLNWNHLLQQWKPALPFTRLALLNRSYFTHRSTTCSLWTFVYYMLWVDHNSLVNRHSVKKSVINYTTYLQITNLCKYISRGWYSGLCSELAKKRKEKNSSVQHTADTLQYICLDV